MLRTAGIFAIVMVAAAIGLPLAAHAQYDENEPIPGETHYAPAEVGTVFWDIDGGVGIPVGRLHDLENAGGTVGLGIGYVLTPALALKADGNVEFLQGRSRDIAGAGDFPDLNLWNYMGTLEARMTGYDSPWIVKLDVGAGATTFNFRQNTFVTDAGDLADISKNHTYFTLQGGAEVRYQVSPQLDFFGHGDALAMFTKKSDFDAFTNVDGARLVRSTSWSIPVTVGFSFRM